MNKIQLQAIFDKRYKFWISYFRNERADSLRKSKVNVKENYVKMLKEHRESLYDWKGAKASDRTDKLAIIIALRQIIREL
jgi:hypothetical protein